MIRVAIVDEKGKVILPKDLATAAELRAVASQATDLIRECEQLARLKEPQAPAPGKVPYLS